MLREIGFLFLFSGSLFINTGCGVHSYDKSETPSISISKGQSPVISWTPNSAYRVSVHIGKKTTKGRGRPVWERNSLINQNNIHSPLTVDMSLETGKTYTVEINRKDPKGTGGGFSNTHHTYIGRKIFTVE